MKILGIIPARYKSSRFPGKPLVNLNGKPMIVHVAQKAAQALGTDNVIIATDDERIADVVQQAGFNTIITSDSHPTGTDRLWEVAQNIEADIYINIQGDEPMVNPNDIIKVIEQKKATPQYVINGMSTLADDEDPANINIPKVLVNSKNDLIYMSRLPIPGIKSPGAVSPVYLKQVCIYAFSFNQLKAYGEMNGKAVFEAFEDIEILRFLELGIPVKMVYTQANTLAVDVPTDVEKVSQAMQNNN
ncbi:3-deoxy-manno-octulosonate cytidylyltransferase [Mucilaginibacter terrae]|uniref:3-deoxy-manno-octulosonate cytidylyltransferase (CMP-KDO synthetase) n=1 Tax=Mucilaginibacter terrae TaxID=1955052 RepID=A0ABU3GVL0_9SPHI|nr:3-deoxy-manno-octulosonate cytidylyltransferase [Mucilaginibacter terrae]MDT3403631.1 3-deoxy-manno-octulosonate cytidylyltransferase (CMP-KDO synthetase) [Mucilaginibacter terrae]